MIDRNNTSSTETEIINDEEIPIGISTFRNCHHMINICTRLALASVILLTACVYHRKDSPAHLFKYSGGDAVVLLPNSLDDIQEKEFDREFKLAWTASMTIWIAQPIQLLDGLYKFDVVRIFTFLLPPIYEACVTSEANVFNKVDRARNIRHSKEEDKRLSSFSNSDY